MRLLAALSALDRRRQLQPTRAGQPLEPAPGSFDTRFLACSLARSLANSLAARRLSAQLGPLVWATTTRLVRQSSRPSLASGALVALLWRDGAQARAHQSGHGGTHAPKAFPFFPPPLSLSLSLPIVLSSTVHHKRALDGPTHDHNHYHLSN